LGGVKNLVGAILLLVQRRIVLKNEVDVGNPASDTRKKTEKRRKKYEQRLGPGVYLPREERLKFNEEVKKLEAEAAKKTRKK
jgi:hypothetical protein